MPMQKGIRCASQVMAMVMAGGQGARLMPLTEKRSKPAVPFGSRYRIVDFVLSNLVNSGIYTIYILVQYKAQSLIEHIRKAWTISPLFPDQFVTVVPPQMLRGPAWFSGTADAVRQNIELIEHQHPELVLVLGADHVYRMDLNQMIAFHQEREAEVTVAALPVPIEQSSSFGVIAADADGRIRGFEEKPARGAPMPGDPTRVYASTGNYVFNAACLVRALRNAERHGETDFGKHVLPRMLDAHCVYAYNFADNAIPGLKSYEEQAYWRDVGTIDAYFEAHQDVLGGAPRLDMFNPQWPVFSSNYQGPVARVLRGEIDNSLLGAATVIENARVRNSIVRREAVIEEGAEIDDCIIMDYARIGRGAKLRRAIIDRHNFIEPGTRIGFDPEADRRDWTVTPSGIVV
ncbi:MAG: glucose-1-phosphate adenylyltransferase, partial [Thiohalocapsa sp.]|uniref:glucose-1-phosphate adenylyltransferase n=1 Tax=Thiohalocapsa sp. TaxID=2497641 RepID=UPI0025CE0116